MKPAPAHRARKTAPGLRAPPSAPIGFDAVSRRSLSSGDGRKREQARSKGGRPARLPAFEHLAAGAVAGGDLTRNHLRGQFSLAIPTA